MDAFVTILATACAAVFTPVFLCRAHRRGRLLVALRNPDVHKALAARGVKEVTLPKFPSVSGAIALLGWCWIISLWVS